MVRDKYTLITGGSEGIGYEMAKLFARDKHNLILVARKKDKLEKVKEEIENKYKVKVVIISIDLAVDNNCRKLIEIVDEKNLAVDNLINNVGIGSFGYFHEAEEGFEEKIIDVNIRIVTLLIKHYLKEMIKNKEGRILNVASTAAFVGGPRMAMYYSTKAYVLSLTEALFEEGKIFGIQVSCLCPGPVATGFQEKAGIKKNKSAKKYLMSAEKTAKIAYKGFNKGKAIIIPGAVNKLAVIANKFAPRAISRKFILKNNIQ